MRLHRPALLALVAVAGFGTCAVAAAPTCSEQAEFTRHFGADEIAGENRCDPATCRVLEAEAAYGEAERVADPAASGGFDFSHPLHVFTPLSLTTASIVLQAMLSG